MPTLSSSSILNVPVAIIVSISANFSYIKDGKFYINNNEHLELTAQYYYQALKDGMSSEEFDEWAFVANYRRIMRLLDPTNTDLTK